MPKTKSRVPALPVYDLCGRDGVPEARLSGFKAHNLMRMAVMGLPVPQGFVLGTEWCKALTQGDAAKAHLPAVLQSGIRSLERYTGLGFGSARRPLLVSVRSGAPLSMPGMMDTVLNIGLNETSLAGLLRLTGDHRLMWDSYSRLIQAFAEIVAAAPARPFEAELEIALRQAGVESARQLDFRSLRELARTYLALYREHTGHEFPQDPLEQLHAASQAVFGSWMSDKAIEYRLLNALPDDMGTAVTVQRMVFGNAGGNSGAGVGFTRDPSSGENRLYIDWLAQAQGEDIVSGRRRVSAEGEVPGWLMQKLVSVSEALEASFRDAQEYEFTVENGELFMLQTRTAKRTALASLRIAVEQVESGQISPQEALGRLSAIDLDAIVIRRVESAAPPLGHAIPAGAGVAQGPAAFSVEAAQAFAARGTPAILVRNEVATADIAGIAVVAGVLTASGGRRVSAEGEVPGWLMQKLASVGEALEQAFRDAQDFEFTVENGELFMLQTRTAKRTALASLRIAVEQVESGQISPQEALGRLSAIDLDAIIIRRVDSATPPLGHAIPAGAGVAQGPAAFSVEAAQAFAARGTPAILVRNEVATADIAGIAVVAGVLTASGGRTSHAAVVARQMGKVCLVGCAELAIDEAARQARLGDTVIQEGDPLCLDGEAGTIYADSPSIRSERPTLLLEKVAAWRALIGAEQ